MLSDNLRSPSEASICFQGNQGSPLSLLNKRTLERTQKEARADFIGVKKKNPRVGKLSILTAA